MKANSEGIVLASMLQAVLYIQEITSTLLLGEFYSRWGRAEFLSSRTREGSVHPKCSRVQLIAPAHKVLQAARDGHVIDLVPPRGLKQAHNRGARLWTPASQCPLLRLGPGRREAITEPRARCGDRGDAAEGGVVRVWWRAALGATLWGWVFKGWVK